LATFVSIHKGRPQKKRPLFRKVLYPPTPCPHVSAFDLAPSLQTSFMDGPLWDARHERAGELFNMLTQPQLELNKSQINLIQTRPISTNSHNK